MEKSDIEKIAKWSEPDNLNIRRATPTEAFWLAWKVHREALKRQGVRAWKTTDGEWKVNWTVPIPTTPRVHTRFMTPHELKKHQAFVPSDEQMAIWDWFEHGTNNCVVRARAGTGKTETGKRGMERAPENRMLYVVFNKKNQREASLKMVDPRIDTRTFHSVGRSCVARVLHGVKPEDEVERDRAKDIVGQGASDELIQMLVDMTSVAKNSFINPTLYELQNIAEQHLMQEELSGGERGEVDSESLAQMVMGILELSKTRDPLNRISFDDMVWLPMAMNWVKPEYDLILVDEAQDMNAPQLEMAVRLCAGRLCIVGDDRQCIYGFRGAVPDGLGMMKARLNAQEFPLTTTYRCPKRVVFLAQEFVPDYRAADSAQDGLIDDASEDSLHAIAQPGDAVLSRTNAQLMPLCLSLLRRNVPARIEGRDVGKQLAELAERLKAKSVPDFIERLQKWGDKMRARLAKKRDNQAALEQVNDRVATLHALAEGTESVNQMLLRIGELFSDSVDVNKPAVVFSTVHKAKGLEWNRVFIVRSTFLRKRTREEENIYYVALTRAKKHLTFLVNREGSMTQTVGK